MPEGDAHLHPTTASAYSVPMSNRLGIEYFATSIVITPPVGTPLAGYFTPRRAKGVYDDLYASILVLRRDGRIAVFVACDLVGVPETIAKDIREGIETALGGGECAVLVSATHTHTGPSVGQAGCEDYDRELVRRVVAAAEAATDAMAPGTLDYGTAMDTRFGFNRRYIMKDGSVLTNPGANNPEVVGPAGTVDHSVNVLRVVGADSEVRAMLVNCTAHPDTVDGEMVSADWPGYLRAEVLEDLGRDIPVLVLNGPAGDVNHFDVMNHRVVQDLDEAKRIGAGFGQTVLSICRRCTPLAAHEMDTWCDSVEVPYRQFSDREVQEGRTIVAELENDPEALLNGHLESQDIARGSKAVKLMFARLLVEAAEKNRNKTKTIRLTVVRLGELAIVGVNGEPFTDIGLAIKDNRLFAHTIVAELVNGSAGYLGTKKAYAEGGYETLWGDRVCDDAEDYIMDLAMGLLRRAAGAG